jgi:2-polyprenyl-3-methyl-5-hydroxy-6-metoxy-1,4-benzoquinol methylase
MKLTDRETHFEFGENWRDYAATIDQSRIDSAISGVRKLFPEGLAGKSFLDIGCGSGLHSLAALLAGAALVVATDIDENSVATTRDLLTKYAPRSKWSASILSVFDATPEALGEFDVVYSWGVLHHTGDMWRAIDCAAALVKPGGQFAIAIYSATKMDAPWTLEKRIYSSLPTAGQWIIRQAYMAAWLAGKTALGQNPITIVKNYYQTRGMSFSHDAHDWLGGYPYQTASAEDIRLHFAKLGLKETRAFPLPKTVGLFGSGCHQFVFTR